jgi:aspartate racemase
MHAIGILAHSADGAALCFLEMVRESARLLGPHRHPEITLSILPMGDVLPAYERGNHDAVRTQLTATAARLRDAGCAFFACPDNTAHLVLERPGPPLPLPGLHIAEIVAASAARDGRRRVGLLGTRWTMEGAVYPEAFARAGVELRVPDAAAERAYVDHVIFDELCRGLIDAGSRARFVSLIERFARDGCDAVALSCTEIPLLVTAGVSPLPTLDSTRLLAHEAVATALGRREIPSWRGGPPVAGVAAARRA